MRCIRNQPVGINTIFQSVLWQKLLIPFDLGQHNTTQWAVHLLLYILLSVQGFNPLAESENKICTRCNIARDRRCITAGWGSAGSVLNWAFAAEPVRTNPVFFSRLQIWRSHLRDLVVDPVRPRSAVHLFSVDTSGPGSGTLASLFEKVVPGVIHVHSTQLRERTGLWKGVAFWYIHAPQGFIFHWAARRMRKQEVQWEGRCWCLKNNKDIYSDRTDSVFCVEHQNEEVSLLFSFACWITNQLYCHLLYRAVYILWAQYGIIGLIWKK